jgi:hypothetical protein
MDRSRTARSLYTTRPAGVLIKPWQSHSALLHYLLLDNRTPPLALSARLMKPVLVAFHMAADMADRDLHTPCQWLSSLVRPCVVWPELIRLFVFFSFCRGQFIYNTCDVSRVGWVARGLAAKEKAYYTVCLGKEHGNGKVHVHKSRAQWLLYVLYESGADPVFAVCRCSQHVVCLGFFWSQMESYVVKGCSIALHFFLFLYAVQLQC